MMVRPGTRARRRRASDWARWLPALAGLVLLLLLAPAFSWAQGAVPDSVALSWTAPGDDGNVGTATLYDLRMSTSPLDAGTWDVATPVAGMPAPLVAGTRQTFMVHGLTNGTTYWFAIRTQDDAGNWSAISNVLRFDWTFDTAPPAAPTGIAATLQGANVLVTWNANAEPDLAGYRVYRALLSAGPWTLISGGTLTATQFTDTAVPNGSNSVWYSVTALDVSGNESARGAAAQVVLPPPSGGNAVAWGIETGFPNPSEVGTPVQLPVMVPPDGAAGASIEIVDAAGRMVRRLDIGSLAPGAQLVTWDGRNDAGRDAAPGAYTAWLLAQGTRHNSRLVRVP